MNLRLHSAAVLLLIATAELWSLASPAVAQDSHYWSQHYGPQSSLLGGAVIGSVDDVSSTYYNPGALTLASNLAFAVSANVFEVKKVVVEDGGGNGVDLGTTKSGLRPSMVAGTIKKGMLGGGGILAYSAITRARGTQNLNGVLLLTEAELPPELQLKDAAGSASFTGRFNDFWGGITYSQALGEHFGLGVTWYGAVRSQERRREEISQLIAADGTGIAEIDLARGSYTTFRTLFKAGAFAKVGSLSGGVTVTTASIHLSGSGELEFNQSAFGSDTTALIATTQTDLSAVYKSPLSVGAGLAWHVGDAHIHGSLEWFDEINPYLVMQGDDVTAQEPDSVVMTVDAVQEQDEVLNWALAIEYAFSPSLSGYISYYTDNSTLTDDVDRAALGALPLDLNNVTVGSDFVVRSARFTLGVGYGWGSKVDQELANLLRGESENLQPRFVYRSFRFLFGFEIGVG